MTSFKLAALALVLALGLQDGEAKLTKDKRDFIRKMRQSEKINGPIRMSKPNLARFLQKAEQVGNLKGSSPKVSKEELERKLTYYQSFDEYVQSKATFQSRYSSNEQENQDQGPDGENQNTDDSQELQSSAKNWWNFWSNNQSADDDKSYTFYTSNSNQEGEAYENIEGFSDLSLKYAGCTSATSFVTQGDEDSSSIPFKSSALVQYRFCPSDSCQEDSWEGCSDTYGEYMMSLQDFLDTQHILLEEEFNMVCNYCAMCYDFNENYCTGDDCCTHSDDCREYENVCKDKQEDEEENEDMEGDNQDLADDAQQGDDIAQYDYGDVMPDYSDLFECLEVEVDQNDQISYYMSKTNNDDDDTYYESESSNNNQEGGKISVYLGVHCNGMYMEVGVFKDDTCTTLLATEEQVDIRELTGLEYNSEDLDEFYVPQGCIDCGGDEYNWKNQWWYVQNTSYGTEDEARQDEESNINYVCYDLYSASAKCNSHLSEEIQEKLGESDSEMANEAATCTFINQAMQGNIDENGFVLSDYTYVGANYSDYSELSDTVTPVYGSENRVTGGQAAALSIGAIGTAMLVGTVFRLKRQVEALDDTGAFIAIDDKSLD